MQHLDGGCPPGCDSKNLRSQYRRRLFWRIFLKNLYSPVINANAFFSWITIPFTLYFLSAFLGEHSVVSRMDTLGVGALSIIAAMPIWAIIILLISPFRVGSFEKNEGRWTDGRFVFKQPKLVHSFEWRPSNNGGASTFDSKIDGGLLVDYRIEADGPVERINCVVIGAYYFRPLEQVLQTCRFDLRGRVVVRRDGTLSLLCHSRPDTLPVIVRVYVLAFECNPQVRMDYTDATTQTRFVLAPPDQSSEASSQVSA
jgi:hypothetical protein